MSDHIERHVLAFAQARVPSRIVRALPCPIMEDGTIHPQATLLKLADGRFSQVVHIKPVYYETRAGFWRPLSEICLYHGNKRIVLDAVKANDRAHPRFLSWLAKRQRLFGRELGYAYAYAPYVGVRPWEQMAADSLTVRPDPNPETTTFDGHIAHNNATWATVQGASAGTAANDSDATSLGVISDFGVLVGSQYSIYRAFLLFNTAAIGAGSTVTAATLSGYVHTKVNDDNDGTDVIGVYSSTPASNTGLVTGDFDQCGDAIDNPTAWATPIDIGSISTGAYTDWALNATGIAGVSLTSVTKTGMREGHDATDSAVVGGGSYILVYPAERAGTTEDPKLVVTYTPAATPVPVMLSQYRRRWLG